MAAGNLCYLGSSSFPTARPRISELHAERSGTR
jgi:hypothetical protein